MIYRVTKEFRFEAAHHLTKVPEEHKCRRPHGHSYRVEVTVESKELDERGMVVDYAELADVFKDLILICDHKDLNEVFSFETTAENLATFILNFCIERIQGVASCRVYETPTTIAEVIR